MYMAVSNMIDKQLKCKYWFPLLENHLKKEGMKHTEFEREAYKVSPEPKARTWANAMKQKHGVSETTAYKIVKVLEGLSFPKDVCTFQQTSA